MGGERNNGRSQSRGQSYVLEAIGAAIIVLAGVTFAIQATAVTPLSMSTSSQHVENQERLMADTALEQAATNGSLKEAVLYWNPDNRTFQGAAAEGYLGTASPNRFGRLLNRTFRDQRIATNVEVVYSAPSGAKSRTMIYQGSPSNNAVTATHTLVLVDSDHLTADGYGNRTLNASDAAANFYAPDVSPDSQLYNVVEVRLVAWRM